MDGWIAVELTLPVAADALALDILSGELFGAGAAGLEVKGDAAPVVVVVSFSPETAPADVRAGVDGALEVAGLEPTALEVKSVEPIDWATHWRRNFEPIAFGDVWVVPSWLDVPEGAERVLRIDPGMAFGTGNHETTAMCLERIVAGPVPRTLLDVGTGTAILSMGALLAGTERAVGTDNDPEALRVAGENAEANGLADRLVLSGSAPDALGETFEMVVANILKGPLLALAPSIARARATDGRVLLSGLLVTQVDDAIAAYEGEGLLVHEVVTRGEWALIEMR